MMRRLVLAALLAGCADAQPRVEPAAGPKGWLTQPAPATAASVTASAPEPAPVQVSADGPTFDPAAVRPVLDDPRLSAVRAAMDRDDPAAAAAALSKILTVSPPSEPEDERVWLYQLGRLRERAGDPLGAAKAFDGAAKGAPWALTDHARLAAAILLDRAGQHDAALERARAIQPGLAADLEVRLVMARALAGKGDVDAALPHYEAYLARAKRPSNWSSVALEAARALLERPSVAHAERAAVLARRVIFEAPGGAGAGEAQELERRALSTLPVDRRRKLETATPDELLDRARSLVSSGQAREAIRVTDALVGRADVGAEIVCRAYLVRAEALSKLKRKAEAADVYGEAETRCTGTNASAQALYAAGRASASAGRPAEAVLRFAKLEKLHPKHALADDARVRGARAALELGDEARHADMLSKLPDDYPDGDAVGDGLFELALSRMVKRDWAGAVVPLERGLARPPERTYSTAGRFAYFLGRAHIETGAIQRGFELLARVIAEQPLGYYMTLAHARLAERDAAAAEKAIRDALERSARDTSALPVLSHPAFAEPAFLRAVELARQGDDRLARGELDLLGVGARTAPPAVLWASALLLARTGSPSMSHALLRTSTTHASGSRIELTDWVSHYPVGAWRSAWELAFPRPFADVVAKEAQRHGIPEALAYAIMREESAFDPRAVSSANAIGLMQLIVPTAKRMAKPLGLTADAESLKRPSLNVALGCRYLSVLRDQFKDNPLLAIPGYNAGGGAPKRWLDERPTEDFDLWVERIPYEETRLYTKRVIASLAAYEFLYGQSTQSEVLRSPLAASPAARAAATLAASP